MVSLDTADNDSKIDESYLVALAIMVKLELPKPSKISSWRSHY